MKPQQQQQGEYTQIPTDETDVPVPGVPGVEYQEPYYPPPEYHTNAQLAAAKSMAYLMRMEALGYCGVEKSSVYGAAVAIPQVARSADWSTTLCGLAIRSYIFLFLNLFLQFFLLAVINEELHIMSPFAGHPHLCDFGASVGKCPDGPNCKGPAGSTYTFARTYSFSQWSTRMFIRDALRQLFPHKAEDIDVYADPGEWGLEDYYCRLACCFIFVMGVVDDLKGTMGLLTLLTHTPTAGEPWIKYEVPDWEEKEKAKQVHGWTELDLVKYEVAGMPLGWKIMNFVFVFLPKCWIWWTLTSVGFHFLMETAGIVELVVNCMALTFILSIDEMVFEKLATVAAKHIMNSLQDKPLFELPDEENEVDESSLQRFQADEFGHHRWKLLCLVLPKRLLIILGVLAFFTCRYYYQYCDRTEDGSWVSKAVYTPKTVPYNPLSFIYGLFLDLADDPVWPLKHPLRADDGG
mmetsp:Transcript_104254/g.270240  ORF Transcript_104254/g.270240 Transcript_104254/m.270240 type:complete len:463 (+) Transcript_104254:173-1561(+)